MKVLLISSNLCRDPYPVYPLGMGVVAAALQADGHAVQQFDAQASSFDALPHVLAAFQPDVVGISIRNLDTVNHSSPQNALWQSAQTAVQHCRTFRTDLPIILGGAGFSLLPETICRETGADFGIVGEGEQAIRALLNEWPKPVVGTALRRGEPGEIFGADYPAELTAFYVAETHILPIQSKRGCPFRCAYCSYPLLEGRRVRSRDANAVLDQMSELLARHPDVLFHFVDAVFNDPQREFVRLLQRMEERGLRFPFMAFLTPSGLHAEDVCRMRERGLLAAELGIDAASDATLRGLGKNFTFAEARQSTKLLQKAGIGVTASVLFGGPGETPETIAQGIENLRQLDAIQTLIYAGIRILPGTQIEAIALREHQLSPDWNPAESTYYFAPGLEPQQLQQTLLAAFGEDRLRIYPPDRRNDELRLLHRIGYRKIRENLSS